MGLPSGWYMNLIISVEVQKCCSVKFVKDFFLIKVPIHLTEIANLQMKSDKRYY